SLGGEGSLHLGASPFSHAQDDIFAYPIDAWGLNAGWMLTRAQERNRGLVYFEAQRTQRLGGIAAGRAWDPGDDAQGPQAAGSVGPFYVRVAHLFDHGTALTVGVVVKGWVVRTWSR